MIETNRMRLKEKQRDHEQPGNDLKDQKYKKYKSCIFEYKVLKQDQKNKQKRLSEKAASFLF